MSPVPFSLKCPNEDADFDGILDPIEESSALSNQNGALEPGGVAATSLGLVTTGSDGSATIEVLYPQDHAFWVQVELTAKAGVQGTEGVATATFWLPALAAYLSNQNSDPPNRYSPYGLDPDCTNTQ